ncbi:LysR family transcriptional regulator [Acinetobacter sp. NRRL B-65365]|uniref:LysR substrate-binding domain-containing protein n=1 Tax=Acinetobacter sp. NRRL B-65365 TaxID=1785092 RepID=UPI0007A0644E|nr:LysR substrate-binding domain-containing protein [Acinetobacter sp. NRRL B-65365]KYQ81091.1 LysR family transcriptional regulator [Acinetobacter sp. NRRL B-65365]
MQDLNDLYYFAKIVEFKGFAAASRALDIPKSKLSRRIQMLEERLGVRLLHRSSRKFSVTEIGQQYYHYCHALLMDAENAQEFIDLNRTEPRGIIRVSCPPALLHYHMGEFLTTFMLQYPKLRIYIDATNRNVDVLNEGIDIAFRVRYPPLKDSDLVMKKFVTSAQCLVAHPRVLSTQPIPRTLDELHQFRTIGLGNAEQQNAWVLHHAEQGTVHFQHDPDFIVNDMTGVLQAVIHGLGIAPLPIMMAHEYIERKELIMILPEWQLTSGIVHAAYASRKGLLPAIKKLLDYLEEQFALLDQKKLGYQ